MEPSKRSPRNLAKRSRADSPSQKVRIRSLIATKRVTRVGVVSILNDFGGRRFEATENRIIFCDLVVWRNNVGGAGSGRLGP